MARSTMLAIGGLLGAGLFCSLSACGSDEPSKSATPTAGQAGGTVMMQTQTPVTAGRPTAGSGGTTTQSTTAGMGASGIGAQAGMAAAGRGGSGQAGGSAAGMGGAGGAAGSAEEDIFDIFGIPDLGQPTCEGLLCLEAADCAALYPDENAACKFTKCEDFACK